jgi:hypothetical protein
LAAAVDSYDFWDKAQNRPGEAMPQFASRLTPTVSTYSSTYGATDAGQDLAKFTMRQFGYSREELDRTQAAHDYWLHEYNPLKAGGYFERKLGFSPNPAAWVGLADTAKDAEAKARERLKGTPADPAHYIEPGGYGTPPAFMSISDVYRSATLSAVSTTPLDAELKQARMENYQKMVEELQEANGHLKAIADKDKDGVALRAR